MILALNSHCAVVAWKSHEFGKNQDGTKSHYLSTSRWKTGDKNFLS